MEGVELWRGLDRAARHVLPAASIAFAIIALAMPGLIPAQPEVRVGFVVASVYFWSLYRPASLPAPVVALLGVLLDLLGASPLGMWAVLLLLEQATIGVVRRSLVRQSFLIVWLVFAAFVVTLTFAEYLVRGVLELSLLPPEPIIMQAVIAILIYPVIAVALIRAHRGAAAPEQA
ncbi:MAG: rod shape-determining protein MreD [Acidiphilium sp.]|nr:rod shape-determining protein MreD [Acidiphilium sp.]MDD4934676.1 rod shape-determining protein MreD [Acidiphilium sp.]